MSIKSKLVSSGVCVFLVMNTIAFGCPKAFADENSTAVPVMDPFPKFAAAITPDGPVPVISPPALRGYSCSNVDPIFVSSGDVVKNLAQPEMFLGTPIAVPASCTSPDSACNCLAMTLQNGSDCIAGCGQNDTVCVVRCVTTMQSGLGWCTNTDGFC